MRFFIKIILILIFLHKLTYAQIDTIDNHMKIGLVLSGGGAKGFAHIGVLKVLEEKNIEVDFISGTSMGAIVGGLYAMGYSAGEIENMIKSQDWQKIFSDKIDRKNLSLYERRDIERYILHLPIGKKGIKLPEGILGKKNIINSLSKIAKQYNAVIDFKKDLPKPFVCVATNLETGEEILLDKGNFVTCIYASMAIPAVFPPAKINDNLLIDGGISNNFPVEKLKEMGAQIIIGSDVQYNSRKKSEIKNITDIVFQMLEIYTKPATDSTKIKLCDYYLKPNLKNFRMDNFSDMDDIIKIGEESARKYFNNTIGINDNPVSYNFQNSYKISDIAITNLPSGISKKDFLRTFKISLPKVFTDEDIQILIKKIYYRYSLSFVHYFFSGDNKDILTIELQINNNKTFNLGLHFNQDQGAEILVNTSFYNVGFKHSKLSLDAIFSRYPGFQMKYSILTKRFPGINISTRIKNYQFNLYNKSKKVFSNDLTSFKFDINTNFLFRNSYAIGGGFQLLYLRYKEDPPNTYNKEEFFTSLYTFLDINTLDNNIFPKKGTSLYAEMEYFSNKDFEFNSDNELYTKYIAIFYLNFIKAYSIKKKFAILPTLQLRGIVSNTENIKCIENYIYGENNTSFFDTNIQFIGAKYIQAAEYGVLVGGIKFRYEPWTKHYITLNSNFASVLELNRNISDMYYGYGLSYSYNSIIGPLTLTFANSNIRARPIVYFNLGYYF